MKKLLAIGIAAAMTAGCGPSAEPEQTPEGSPKRAECGTAGGVDHNKVSVVIDGHDYIVASGTRGISIIHSESCPCRNADTARYTKTVVDGKTWLVPECGRGTAGIPLTE